MTFKNISLVFLSSMAISGCVPLVLGAAATGTYLGVQERGAKTAVHDTVIKTGIKDRLTNMNYRYLGNVGVHVLQGSVLLTGIAPNQKAINDIERVAQTEKGVSQVYNDVLIGSEYNAKQKASDAWVATQLRTRLLGAKDVYSVNYITDVINGSVYILGLAGSESEMERVLHVARTTKGAQKVHNYIRVTNVTN